MAWICDLYALQDDPPKPRDDKVEIIRLSGGRIYVKSFCGFPRSGEIISRGTAFIRSLKVGGDAHLAPAVSPCSLPDSTSAHTVSLLL